MRRLLSRIVTLSSGLPPFRGIRFNGVRLRCRSLGEWSQYLRKKMGAANGPSVSIRQFKFSMRVCGPKFSLCCLVLSIWGILQLTLMGLAFTYRSVGFVEDIAWKKTQQSDQSIANMASEMDSAYERSANNCYVAALLYLVTFLISLHQHWLNKQPTPAGYARYT